MVDGMGGEERAGLAQKAVSSVAGPALVSPATDRSTLVFARSAASLS